MSKETFLTLGPDYFDMRIEKGWDIACWIWCGTRSLKGYGRAKIKGAEMCAHRLAYLLFVGDVPEELQVCHKCDIPACCNPDHLFLGTALDNKRDSMAKGRHAKGKRLPFTKLSVEDYRRIRAIWKPGRGVTMRIAKSYGVSKSLIHQIANGLKMSDEDSIT